MAHTVSIVSSETPISLLLRNINEKISNLGDFFLDNRKRIFNQHKFNHNTGYDENINSFDNNQMITLPLKFSILNDSVFRKPIMESAKIGNLKEKRFFSNLRKDFIETETDKVKERFNPLCLDIDDITRGEEIMGQEDLDK